MTVENDEESTDPNFCGAIKRGGLRCDRPKLPGQPWCGHHTPALRAAARVTGHVGGLKRHAANRAPDALASPPSGEGAPEPVAAPSPEMAPPVPAARVLLMTVEALAEMEAESGPRLPKPLATTSTAAVINGLAQSAPNPLAMAGEDPKISLESARADNAPGAPLTDGESESANASPTETPRAPGAPLAIGAFVPTLAAESIANLVSAALVGQGADPPTPGELATLTAAVAAELARRGADDTAAKPATAPRRDTPLILPAEKPGSNEPTRNEIQNEIADTHDVGEAHKETSEVCSFCHGTRRDDNADHHQVHYAQILLGAGTTADGQHDTFETTCRVCGGDKQAPPRCPHCVDGARPWEAPNAPVCTDCGGLGREINTEHAALHERGETDCSIKSCNVSRGQGLYPICRTCWGEGKLGRTAASYWALSRDESERARVRSMTKAEYRLYRRGGGSIIR